MSRYWDYVDERGNLWQTIVERTEHGWRVREGMRAPGERRWVYFPITEFGNESAALSAARRYTSGRIA